MSMNYYEENDDQDESDQVMPENASQGSTISSRVTDEVRKRGSKELQKKVAQKGAQTAAKAGAKAAGSSSLAAAIAPVLAWVVVIILILIILIGMIVFLVTMPGMAMQKLKELFSQLSAGVAAFFGADTTQQIDSVQIYSILDYLEQMGYDLKGYGFLSDFADENDEATAKDENPKKDSDPQYEDIYPDLENGVYRYNVDDTIAYAKADFIFQYIMSDNYIYTLKNDNIDTQSRGEGFWSNFWPGAHALGIRLMRFFGTANGSWGDEWGKGLIAIYQEEGGLGSHAEGMTNDTFWQWISGNSDKIKIDVDSKKLVLEKGGGGWFASNNPLEYDLNGWTGRYGMPLEFLLSMHMATMMPDLAYDMTRAFPTEIALVLRTISGEVVAAYEGNNGQMITEEDVKKNSDANSPLWAGENETKWREALGKQEWITSDLYGAVTSLLLGMGHSEECTCKPSPNDPEWDANEPGTMIIDADGYECYLKNPIEITDENIVEDFGEGATKEFIESLTEVTAFEYVSKLDDSIKSKVFKNLFVRTRVAWGYSTTPVYTGNGKTAEAVPVKGYFYICDKCKAYSEKIMSAIDEASAQTFEGYLPYIANVKDHWFRDVHFVAPLEDSVNFVKTDADFEKVMKERWTVYEVFTEEDLSSSKFSEEEKAYAKEHMGEYELYYVPDDGKDVDITEDTDLDLKLWMDTIEEATKQGIKLTKKAVTFNSETTYEDGTNALEDLGWNKGSNDLWTAYKDIPGKHHSGFKPAYPPEEAQKDTDGIKPRIFVDIVTEGNIVQTGEGLRSETNSRIKKMFMQANYFQYDGKPETAEKILELRKLISNGREGLDSDQLYYGLLKNEDMSTIDGAMKNVQTTNTDPDNTNDKDKKINENRIYGKANITEKSLEAFSMLENTHTLDADSIYRDFKELIVELGYFEKKELMDTTPRLMAWFIPECGSFGWPKKELDNRENYVGAMAHSIEDYKANEKNTTKAILREMGEEVSKENQQKAKEINYPQMDKNMQSISAQISGGGASSTTQKNPGNKTPQQVSLNTFLDTTKKMCKEIDEIGYDYCVFNGDDKQYAENPTADTISCNHAVWHNDCKSKDTLCTTFEQSKSDTHYHNLCCATLASWALQNVEVMPDSAHVNGVEPLAAWINSNLDPERIEKGEPLEEGDFLFYDRGHVDICGRKNSSATGGFEKYNGGHYAETGATELSDHSSINHVGTEWDYALRIPWGNQRKPGIWKGYEGNEAVVSPVTGILLDYGVYEEAKPDNPEALTPDDKQKEEEKDENSPENEVKERLNVDLYEGSPNTIKEDRNENNPDASIEVKGEQPPELNEETYERYDKVGYAKILVLTPEMYRIIEQSTTNRWNNGESSADKITQLTFGDSDKSLVRIKQSSAGSEDENAKNYSYFDNPLLNTEQMNKEHENWSDIDKTIYGYKEFAELYDKFGISGYEIYIDGFVCETPDAELAAKAEEDKELKMYKEMPNGKPITIDTFKVDQSSIGKELDEDGSLLSMYYAPEERKLISDRETKRMLAEDGTKAMAHPALRVDNPLSKITGADPNLKYLDDIILIKEGTVLGRTMTDMELFTEVRTDEPQDDFQYYRQDEDEAKTDKDGKKENLNKVIGNYINVRIIDSSNKNVEHVEDYFLLDEYKRMGNDWELFFWLPFESYGTDKPGGGPECQGTCSDGETAVGIIQWTVLRSSNMNNIVSQFIPGCVEENPTLCAPLNSYLDWGIEKFVSDYGTKEKPGPRQFQACLKQICEVDRDEFLRVQMEVAKKQYLEPLLKDNPWLKDRPKCVQGAIMHLRVWGAKTNWLSSYKGKSDEEIIMKVRETIANTGSTAGKASRDTTKGRAYNEPQIALEILEGNLAEEDVEKWVRTGEYKYLPFKEK